MNTDPKKQPTLAMIAYAAWHNTTPEHAREQFEEASPNDKIVKRWERVADAVYGELARLAIAAELPPLGEPAAEVTVTKATGDAAVHLAAREFGAAFAEVFSTVVPPAKGR